MKNQDPERTFQYQDSLPALPVPSLDRTLSKYLDAVRPFASEEAQRGAVATVRRFREGVGEQLQQKLQHRAQSCRNWLEEWWLDAAYLSLRSASQISFNFGGPAPFLEHCWSPAEGTQLYRSSINTWYTLQYWDLIRTERLPPQKTGNNVVFDMDQYRMLFCTCKVPGLTKDTLINYFKTDSEGVCPSHVVVMCRGRIFTFDALCEGHILTPPEIQRQLSYVQQYCSRCSEGDGVAVLTSLDRTLWAKIRRYLISIDPNNENLLEIIQSSLFVISLDQSQPSATPLDYTQIIHQALTGDATIRWGDKSYNSLCFSNGTFGCNCDHAPYDGMVMVSLYDYIDKQLKASHGVWTGTDTVRPMPDPEQLVFTVDDAVRRHISQAKQHYMDTTQDLQVVCYAFTSFGRSAISQRKIHPDTFIQLAMQLAYYTMYGSPGSCYETAMTRRFYHGRTETMRPCTVEAVAWCSAMLDPSCSMDVRRRALLQAVNKHNRLMTEARNGQGFDRHLLGLSLIAKEEGLPVPDLFLDPLYVQSGGGGNFVLSSSPVGHTTVLGAGAPMVHHGYGVFYRFTEDRIVAAITAWKSNPQTDAERFYQHLCTSLQDILHLATTSPL